MVINPFRLKESKITPQTITIPKIADIQQYVIANYMEYLQKDLKEELAIKIREFLLDRYQMKEIQEQDQMIELVINKMFGYDILQPYIDRQDVSDIRAVSYQDIYIKTMGKWQKESISFTSNSEFEEYIRYCIIKNNANINFDCPMVVVSDKKYHLRIEAGISPVNQISSSITIRIHRPYQNINLETLLLSDGMLDNQSYDFILQMIKNEKNIILSGKGGSGKTTLLKAIIERYPSDMAITINEETTELYIQNKNVIQREVVENREENKKVTLEKLLRNSLVLSSDVIVTGEIKGSEAAIFLDAVSTGHIGLATVHSNSAHNTIDRLVMLYKRDVKTQQYSEQFVKQLIATSIDCIIYMKNYQVQEIMNVLFNADNHQVNLQSIYRRSI